MEILVTGASGLVGSELAKLPSTVGKTHSELDITSIDQVEDFAAIVNCAAFTNTKAAEGQQEQGEKSLVFQVNALGAERLAAICAQKGIFFVQISTDFVRNDGNPVLESCGPVLDPKALGWYAYTKAVGEQKVLTVNHDVAIVRISRPVKKNAGFHIKSLPYKSWHNGYEITPTLIDELKLALGIIIPNKMTGVFHVASSTSATPAQYLKRVAGNLGDDKPREEINGYDGKIPRKGLSVTETQKRLNLSFRTWKEQVDYLTS